MALGCPAPPGGPAGAGEAAVEACAALEDPDDRAVCDARRDELDELTRTAAQNMSLDDRRRALDLLNSEPCFPLASTCETLARRLEDEPDAATRVAVAAAASCRCGGRAWTLLAERIRTAGDARERLALIQVTGDAIVRGRAEGASEREMLALANVLVARLDDAAEDPAVRGAAAGLIPLLGVEHATDRLLGFTDDEDPTVRLRAQVAAGQAPAVVPGLLDRLRSPEPRARAEALALLHVASEAGGADPAVTLEAMLIGGEDPSPEVRETAGRFDPTLLLFDDRPRLARVAAAHLLRGEVIREAPADLSLLPVREMVTSTVRRQVLAAAALLAAGVPGPSEGAGEGSTAAPFGTLETLVEAADVETRLAALAALRAGLEEAATVRRPPDRNPLVEAIRRVQGDRVRVLLSLGGAAVAPGAWEALLPTSARRALERPLERALLDLHARVAAWLVPGGDETSERARLTYLYEGLFRRGFADETAAAAEAAGLEAAARAADLVLEAERRAEVAATCLSDAGTPWTAGFPRALGELQALAAAAAQTRCLDEDLALLLDDLARACGAAAGPARAVVEERCAAPR
ncbi:MAG: hypothetical protein GYA57_01205 [Myxococcales bacterium]|nr:hypothetical protein [Myxococcales bacterium]